MTESSPKGGAIIGEDEREHRGDFAEGQEEEEHHPEREPGPDYGRG